MPSVVLSSKNGSHSEDEINFEDLRPFLERLRKKQKAKENMSKKKKKKR